jgi:hypothetical protein
MTAGDVLYPTILTLNLFSSLFIYLFKCILRSPKAMYEASAGKETDQLDTRMKNRTSNMYYLENKNSISAIGS